MEKQGVYLGPRLRRLRRDLGLTQADMASDLDISPSYVALMEGNQRPVTAETLLRLAKAYKIDFSEFTSDPASETVPKLHSLVKDPILADIGIGTVEVADLAHSFPNLAEALLRLHTAYREGQVALADRRHDTGPGKSGAAPDPVAAVRNFLATRRNCFPTIDAACEKLAAKLDGTGELAKYLKERHGVLVRRMPASIMTNSLRRLDWHRKELLIDDTLDAASYRFQLAQQIAYLEFDDDIGAIVAEGKFEEENARRLAHRSIASYCAAAIIMPYAAFAKAADSKRYDIEALSRLFSTSFEQTAHRLTTLQKPGQERIPFFFLKVDPAGNVSKRLNSASFPFARHGGGCPLWTVHQAFATPRKLRTQWLELPDGQRFFSVARTVSAGRGGYGVPTVERSVALVCEAQYAERMIYAEDHPQASKPTEIGISCRLCQRTGCTSRSEPPIGRQMLADNYRRTETPFGFTDS